MIRCTSSWCIALFLWGSTWFNHQPSVWWCRISSTVSQAIGCSIITPEWKENSHHLTVGKAAIKEGPNSNPAGFSVASLGLVFFDESVGYRFVSFLHWSPAFLQVYLVHV
jgi:hypothetical protein